MMLNGTILSMQHSLRKCRQLEISILLGSLVLVSTLCISLLTMSKSLANIMTISSESFRLYIDEIIIL